MLWMSPWAVVSDKWCPFSCADVILKDFLPLRWVRLCWWGGSRGVLSRTDGSYLCVSVWHGGLWVSVLSTQVFSSLFLAHIVLFLENLEGWAYFCTEAIGSFIITATPGGFILNWYHFNPCMCNMRVDYIYFGVKETPSRIMYVLAVH